MKDSQLGGTLLDYLISLGVIVEAAILACVSISICHWLGCTSRYAMFISVIAALIVAIITPAVIGSFIRPRLPQPAIEDQEHVAHNDAVRQNLIRVIDDSLRIAGFENLSIRRFGAVDQELALLHHQVTGEAIFLQDPYAGSVSYARSFVSGVLLALRAKRQTADWTAVGEDLIWLRGMLESKSPLPKAFPRTGRRFL